MTKAYAFAGNTITVLVSGEDTGGAFAALHVIKPSGSSTPPHSHDAETEVSYVLSGSLGVETEGRITAVPPGGLIVLPPARPHRLFNDSGAHVREFLLCAPARFDQFVAAAGTPVAPYTEPGSMTDEDRRRLVALAPDYGVRLLSSATPQVSSDAVTSSSHEALDVLGARGEVLAKLGEGDDDLVLLRQSLAPGYRIPLHSHADPECFFLERGELDVYRETPAAGWQKLRPEQAIYVDPQIRHAVRNSSALPAELLSVTTVRMVRFFGTIGSPAAGPEVRLASSEELAALPGHVLSPNVE
jgi:quercetin dioxygenase-like cupin family protein